MNIPILYYQNKILEINSIRKIFIFKNDKK